MVQPDPVVSTTVVLDMAPSEAFEVMLREISDSLARWGVAADFRAGGRVLQREAEVGTVTAWVPGETVELEWRPTPWSPENTVTILLRSESEGSGARIIWELKGWDHVLPNGGDELAGWVAGSILAHSIRALTPSEFGDWLTDRRARRPSGRQARQTYRDPLHHWPNFLLILDRLQLSASDRLLEVGCGGGAFLRKALESGCTAVAFDHSPEMVRLARETNGEAVAAGRLRVDEALADQLPVPADEFTCAVMTGVVGFLPDPVAAFREMRRALRPGGRIAVFGSSAVLRGTPAAPEPIASRVRFYEKQELAELARRAGFSEIRVEEPDMEPYARRAGLPDEAVKFFQQVGGAQLLSARKGVGKD